MIDQTMIAKPAGPVMDPDIRKTCPFNIEDALNSSSYSNLQKTYLDTYINWINNSKLNTIKINGWVN